jgi:hypothetical protein
MIEPKLNKKDYVLGSVRSAPFEVINKSGDWRRYLPEYEPQRREGKESNGCTNFGSLNIIEILENFLENRVSNYSERYTAVMSGQSNTGNDPHKVLESICKNGVVPEKELPFISGMRFKDYLSPKPMRAKLIALGEKWADEHIVKHEYIYPPRSATKEEKKRLLTEALKRSPVGVSVYAWKKKNGVYIKPIGARDVHWCVLVAVDNGKPIVYDSYEPCLKTLTWDHFDIAKGVYYKYMPEKKKVLSLLGRVLKLINLEIDTMLNRKKDRSLELFMAGIRHLGTDASPSDIAPDELGCAESVSAIIREILPDMSITPGTWTLNRYMRDDPRFVPVTVPMPGNIVMYPTGTGNGKVQGHVGIICYGGTVMSNTSTVKDRGKWMVNMTLAGMEEYYHTKGGIAPRFYKIVN